MLFVFYMPPPFLISTAWTLMFFIILQHHPLISIITNIYITTQLSYQHNRVHQQQAKQSKNYNHKTISHQEELPPSFSYSFLCFPSSIHSANFFQCQSSLHHPSHSAVPILHNTQTNRIAYPCIPHGSGGEIPTTRMQNGDS